MYFKKLEQSKPIESLIEMPALGMDAETIAKDYRHYFSHTLGRERSCKTLHYHYGAVVMALRDRLMERAKKTHEAYGEKDSRRTYYLSLEYLMGRALGNAMLNLGICEEVKQGLHELGLKIEEIIDGEHDAGLGNGGLGRLAACFLDSCATLQLPLMGYGIRYEYGMFRQDIIEGHQVEEPDHWLRDGNPWELERPELTCRVHFGGRTSSSDENGNLRWHWSDTHDVLAVPYDIPIPGYRNDTVNILRLWSSRATDEFDLGEFNAGEYTESVASKNDAENITMVLYPNDASESGKELRLRQQYFLASASLQDILRRWENDHDRDYSLFAEKNRFQLNDTHPTIAVAELMRLLMDEKGMGWDEAWQITSSTMAYTNHTLLPEALERWPVRMFRQLLPRLLDIIHEINARFLSTVARRWPGDVERQRRMSIIEEGHDPQVRMAYLAIVGSFSINGVAELHSRLLQEGLFSDFYQLWPGRFNNKTNGVTQRRWLAWSNPGLKDLISETIGDEWITDLEQLQGLLPFADDEAFRRRWREVKLQNKARLAALVKADCDVEFPVDALFDVQVKRIHEYKRQLLNVLHVIHLYDRIKRGDTEGMVPRCVLIGGKAAPGYVMAKLIIKLITSVAKVINSDPAVVPWLRLAFQPNYRVSVMEIIAPGTELSEQISTAGKEASGTGNMKFMMNGALTIGTLDGANIEIREAVGDENFFLFGMTTEEVADLQQDYDPLSIIEQDREFSQVIQLLESGHFNQFNLGLFDPIISAIKSPSDPWMVAADFRSYVECQRKVGELYQNQELWTRMSIVNTASSGRFSTDRTMEEYNNEIWQMEKVPAFPLNHNG
jgi:starch phosphorylase